MAHLYITKGTIRAYDAPSDTCSVEFTGDGAIDTWIDGVAVDPSLPRGYLAAGTPCTIAMPDHTKLCESTVVALNPIGTAASSNTTTQSGRFQTILSGTGSYSGSVTFTTAYTTGTPQVTATPDTPSVNTVKVTAVTTTGFSYTVTAPAYSGVYVTWSATGI